MPALSVGNSGQFQEVIIAGVVFRQEQQVMIIVAEAFGVVMHIFGQIGFDADDGVYTARFACFIKLYRAVHRAMIGNRQVLHSQRFRLLYKFLRAAKTVQQRVLGMDM